jgi:EAL domain-containing protein (putative c-di-GMP-specific phosphodiesterase class I)
VRAIIELAHGLNMQAVAEGIETQTQLDVLRQLGCDFGQGYLLHRPMTQDQLCELLYA